MLSVRSAAPVMAGKDLEAAGHTASLIRKQERMPAAARAPLPSIQCGIPSQGMTPPTVKLGVPTSMIATMIPPPHRIGIPRPVSGNFCLDSIKLTLSITARMYEGVSVKSSEYVSPYVPLGAPAGTADPRTC